MADQDTQAEIDAIHNLGDIIAEGESKRGGYDAYNSGTYRDGNGRQRIGHSGVKALESMTVDEILTSSKTRKATDKDRVFAAGKFQVITSTLETAKSSLPLTGKELYTPALQERIFMHFLLGPKKRPTIHSYLTKGSPDVRAAVYDAAKEWASIEVPQGCLTASKRASDGRMGYYGGANSAKAGSGQRVRAALEQARAAYVAGGSGKGPLPRPLPIVEPSEQTTSPTSTPSQKPEQPITTPEKRDADGYRGYQLTGSVGQGGDNKHDDVIAVQTRLHFFGIETKADGKLGPTTLKAIHAFQEPFHIHDGLIERGKRSAKELFSGSVTVSAQITGVAPSETPTTTTEAPMTTKPKSGKVETAPTTTQTKQAEPASYAAIAKNFGATIAGSPFTWHQALWLPRMGRCAKPADLEGQHTWDEVAQNIERQAAALSKLCAHFGRTISITSWLRPPAYNKLIGGASKSMHMAGLATDFHLAGMTAEQVRQALNADRTIYPGRWENKKTWVHLDLKANTGGFNV